MPQHDSQQTSETYARLQQSLGAPTSSMYGAGALRLHFKHSDATTLVAALENAGALVDLSLDIPEADGLNQQLVVGSIDGQAFMARLTNNPSDVVGMIDLRLYASDSDVAAHVGPDAAFQMMDAMLKLRPVPANALPTYLAHRLKQLPDEHADQLVSQVLAVTADYMAT